MAKKVIRTLTAKNIIEDGDKFIVTTTDNQVVQVPFSFVSNLIEEKIGGVKIGIRNFMLDSKTNTTNSGAAGSLARAFRLPILLKKGVEYIFQYEKISIGEVTHISLAFKAGGGRLLSVVDKTARFVADVEVDVKALYIVIDAFNVSAVQIQGTQFREGNVRMDWRPAPEDSI